MYTKILPELEAGKANFTGLLDYKSEYIVFLPGKSEPNGKIEAFR